MLISLAEVMNRRGETVQVEVNTSFDVFKRNDVDYPIRKKTPVRLTMTSPSSKRVLLQAEAEYVLSAPCDRCLREVEFPFEIRRTLEIDFSKSEEEMSFLLGYELDVVRFVFEEILIAFPTKILCNEDCKGICNVCGADGEVCRNVLPGKSCFSFEKGKSGSFRRRYGESLFYYGYRRGAAGS